MACRLFPIPIRATLVGGETIWTVHLCDTAADLPSTASAGDLAILLDTGNSRRFVSGVWTAPAPAANSIDTAAIQDGAVTLAKLASVATGSFAGRTTAGTGVWEALTASQFKAGLAIASTDVSGLGTLATQSGTFSGTSSGTNTGDQTITLTGDVTGSGTGSFAATIGSNKVTLAMMAQMATASFLGRTTAATGNVEVLTATQATALLNTFTSGAAGLVPASGGGTTTYLRADGTFTSVSAVLDYGNSTAITNGMAMN